MVRGKKTKIVLSVFLVCLIFTVAVGYFFLKKEEENTELENVKGVTNVSGVPYIVNTPPVSAIIGEEYVFVIQVVDSDSKKSKMSYDLVEGPSWLFLEGSRLKGTPTVGSEGTYRIVLRVSDGSNSSTKESYILVE